jgi:ABC-type Fe3+/spermidine/putrescine transport system ATPase subunit
MAFLTLEGVSKEFGTFTAVRDVNLTIDKGEFVSLLGPSGCGKTTTLQMIAGLVEPTYGRISLDGRDITREKPNRRGLGVVFQSYALFPHMTVAQNVAFGLEMRRVPSAERMQRVREALSLVQLSSFADRYPRQLSGGQRQRVAIARALVIAPPVLLLDEPLSNLDAKLREEMQFELRRIQRKVGTTTIMVTHDQAEALSISDRVVVMEGGQMTQVDAPYLTASTSSPQTPSSHPSLARPIFLRAPGAATVHPAPRTSEASCWKLQRRRSQPGRRSHCRSAPRRSCCAMQVQAGSTDASSTASFWEANGSSQSKPHLGL